MSVKECNFAISQGAIGRFSVNCYVRRGNATMVLRVIPDKIPTLDELQLSARLKEMALEKRGFVVFCGRHGVGQVQFACRDDSTGATSMHAAISSRSKTPSGLYTPTRTV